MIDPAYRSFVMVNCWKVEVFYVCISGYAILK